MLSFLKTYKQFHSFRTCKFKASPSVLCSNDQGTLLEASLEHYDKVDRDNDRQQYSRKPYQINAVLDVPLLQITC